MKTFKEQQRLTQWWIWLLLGAGACFFIWAIVQQVFLRISVGNKPVSNIVLLLFSLIPFSLLFFAYKTRLITTYDSQEIEIKYFPFGSKTIKWSDIKQAEIITYKFVGFGLRFSDAYGTVYNISGNIGLQLDTSHGKFLIGTSKPDEVKKMLQAYYKEI